MQIVSGLTRGQVLQRLGAKGANATLTGTASENGPIRATLFKGTTPLKGWKAKTVGQVSQGKFSVKLTGIPVGGPYRLRLEAGKGHVEIPSFFVGDVWILAGQSNMEGVGDMTGRAKPHPLVRALSMRRQWRLAEDPLHLVAESPDVCHAGIQCSPETGEEIRKNAIKGVGVGVFFGHEMVKRSGGVPQGLICTAHGGTSMQQWDPARKKLGGESLYFSMLASVRATGQPVAGLLWYQGESDANPTDAPLYTPRMKRLVAASRRDLKQPKLPWVIVQISRHFVEPGVNVGWNNIQEQERLLPSKIKFFETVSAIDLSLDDGIHISAAAYPLLAIRLASAADRLVYGNKHEQRPPQLGRIRETGKPPFYKIEVSFDFAPGGLHAGSEPTGFMLVTPEDSERDLIYKTELKGNTALLHLGNKPQAGLRLHYGHGRSPRCNITDGRGFALPVFGPVKFDDSHPIAYLSYINRWRVTGIIPIAKKLDQLSLPDLDAVGATIKSYPDGFINEHELWQGKAGHAFFQSRLHLDEPMKLEFLMGYDGPFRLWLDGKPFFKNMKGTNPCTADESNKTVSLAAGTHDIHVGMDLNNGAAWGFMLRFVRKDLKKAQIHSGQFVKPTYSI